MPHHLPMPIQPHCCRCRSTQSSQISQPSFLRPQKSPPIPITIFRPARHLPSVVQSLCPTLLPAKSSQIPHPPLRRPHKRPQKPLRRLRRPGHFSLRVERHAITTHPAQRPQIPPPLHLLADHIAPGVLAVDWSPHFFLQVVPQQNLPAGIDRHHPLNRFHLLNPILFSERFQFTRVHIQKSGIHSAVFFKGRIVCCREPYPAVLIEGSSQKPQE